MENESIEMQETLYTFPEGFEAFLETLDFVPPAARKGLLIGFMEYLAVGMV